MTKITEYLEIILEGNDLTFEQAKQLLDTVFEGDVAEVQIAAFLAAMRVKKASVGELAGLASSLREHAVTVYTGLDNLVDTCGTGGAALKTFNISTTAALVAAGAGVYIAKHGNRGITSVCGSADLLVALGVNIDAGPETVSRCIREAHIGFMFAPKFHPAMRHVQPLRKTLDFTTAFNLLGPLANPARAQAQVMGISDASLMRRIAEALKVLGLRRAIIVHSNGLDEISTMGPARIFHLYPDGSIAEEIFDAEQYGIPKAEYDDLAGGDVDTNTHILREILFEKADGPRKDIVVLNAAAAIMAGGLANDFAEGIEKANESICSGKAAECMEKLVELSNC